MGCVSSKGDINDLHPNFFQVMNVDEMFHVICPGQIEITDTELVLYQRGKSPTRWPLRSLRKYGFESEIFTFECGRRCPTGPGIYAFRCRKAEQLFNLLQHNIQIRNLSDDVNINSVMSDFPVPLASSGPPVQRRPNSQTESYLSPSNTSTVTRTHPTLSRPGSVTSNGPISPISITSPPDMPAEFNNNKKRASLEHSYTNSSVIEEAISSPLPYMNLAATISPTVSVSNENYVNLPVIENNSHLYMNITTEIAKEMPNISEEISQEAEDSKHCYANIDGNEIDRSISVNPSLDLNLSAPSTPTSLYVSFREVNYAELVLLPGKSNQVPPDSPNKTKSYVTIDFNKTNALSQSINPRIDIEEGSRKTRHSNSLSD